MLDVDKEGHLSILYWTFNNSFGGSSWPLQCSVEVSVFFPSFIFSSPIPQISFDNPSKYASLHLDSALNRCCCFRVDVVIVVVIVTVVVVAVVVVFVLVAVL